MTTRLLITSGLLLVASVAFAQDYSGDVFRFSNQPINGTARFQGLGGNHAALGGDASTAFGNPAGLGFYNRSELSISPGLNLLNVQSQYIDRTTTATKAAPTLSHAALIFAGDPTKRGTRWKRTTFGITYSQQANLLNEFTFTGLNAKSSLADAFAQDLNRYNINSTDLNNAFNNQTNNVENLYYNSSREIPGTSYLSAAYQLYLVEPIGNTNTYRRTDRVLGNSVRGTQQTQSFSARGRQTQWTFAYAGNLDDKLYLGASVALTRSRYDFTNRYDEAFANPDQIRGLSDKSDLSVRGNGVNASLGAIYKPTPFLQLGVTVQSPTFSSMNETYNRTLGVDVIGIRDVDAKGNPVRFVPDIQNYKLPPNDFEYSMTTPLRASGGATFFAGKHGFITATAEYVSYSGMRVGTTVYDRAADNQAFKSDNTGYVKSIYQNVINFRAGAELRAGMFRVRAGAAYLPSPYKSTFDALAKNGDRNTLLFSGGLGVRNERFFADVSGVLYGTKTAYVPYSVNNPQDYAGASLNSRTTNVTLSIGTFF
jgi:hypothetical protein